VADLKEKLLAELDPETAAVLLATSEQRMGVAASYGWLDDPKRLCFSLARYKFVAKMMEGYSSVLEAGCADGFASRIVAQAVGSLVAVDLVEAFIDSARKTAPSKWPIDFSCHDMLSGPVSGTFDGAYSLDVLEHIPQSQEGRFIKNLIAPLTDHGLCIIGMPSLQSQAHASKFSKQNHINCKDQRDFKSLMKSYFHTVLAFSVNDEVVHTGYHAMSHYNLMVCTGKK
jgi:cyclopropane fatty-acyl-phospholipid synthase-like methyltransferase